MISLVDRLSPRLKIMPGGCWEWQGYRTEDGYGQIRRGPASESMILTHRAMWEIVFGPIPNGLHVLHKCDNPPCCRPAHLWLGTQADNIADMVAKGRGTWGEKNSQAKLTQEQVNAIRADDRIQYVIAADYGISTSQISRIKIGEHWRA